MPTQSSPNMVQQREEPEAAFEDDIPSDDDETSEDAPLASRGSLPTEAEIRTDDEESSSRPR